MYLPPSETQAQHSWDRPPLLPTPLRWRNSSGSSTHTRVRAYHCICIPSTWWGGGRSVALDLKITCKHRQGSPAWSPPVEHASARAQPYQNLPASPRPEYPMYQPATAITLEVRSCFSPQSWTEVDSVLELTWEYPAGSVVEPGCGVAGAGQDQHPGCWSWVRTPTSSLLAMPPREGVGRQCRLRRGQAVEPLGSPQGWPSSTLSWRRQVAAWIFYRPPR